MAEAEAAEHKATKAEERASAMMERLAFLAGSTIHGGMASLSASDDLLHRVELRVEELGAQLTDSLRLAREAEKRHWETEQELVLCLEVLLPGSSLTMGSN